MFKTQQEIWGHLSIEGNKICAGESGTPVWLYEGFVVDGGGRRDYSFANPAFWQPYTEPSWEDKLDGTEENAVWCCVSDHHTSPALGKNNTVHKIVGIRPDRMKYVGRRTDWAYATPLSEKDKQELFPS